MTLTESVQAILVAGPDRWRALVRIVDPQALDEAPAPGAWSPINVLQHLIDVEPVFASRAVAIKAGEDFPAFDQDAGSEIGRPYDTVADVIGWWEALRARSLEVLETITPDDLERTGRHAELGEVTLANLLNEWAGHDLMHMVQAEQALMQPFIHGTGPWRGYFAAHEAAQP